MPGFMGSRRDVLTCGSLQFVTVGKPRITKSAEVTRQIALMLMQRGRGVRDLLQNQTSAEYKQGAFKVMYVGPLSHVTRIQYRHTKAFSVSGLYNIIDKFYYNGTLMLSHMIMMIHPSYSLRGTP